MNHFKNNIKNQQGSVLIELAISLPIFVMVFLSSVEYVRALQAQQNLAVFTDAAAKAAFQDCVELDDKTTCLSKSYFDMLESTRLVLPAAELIVSIYTCDLDLATNTCTSTVKVTQYCPSYIPAGYPPRPNPPTGAVADDSNPCSFSTGASSKYYTDFTTAGTTENNALQKQGKIVVAEGLYQFIPVVNFTPIVRDLYYNAVY
ncbi:MAG: pilus assembly protein [Proteobacteria bacterium]|nr:pilus assembly protein [Pseudomonadota bacterium]